MKKTLFILAAAALFTACGESTEAPTETPVGDTTKTADTTPEVQTEPEVVMVGDYMSFGDQINGDSISSIAEVVTELEAMDTVYTKMEMPITEVCQKKGCWMNVDLAEDRSMMVRFKDYGFFVPADASGKTVIAEGFAYNTVTSVDDLKHYAGDAGKSQEEIDAITEPETAIAFEASGVLIK
jgi:hypothetical protein